ncbi:SEC-C metal-binding domain-containing protein [Sporosarcina sp. NPDC096371]|uniref:IS1096 element passenger TnpR family protein n=1 Tax=Sporosarcina sp. NPDC096371 TaxID=3364530 RepID=UPI00380A43E6
MKAYILNVSFEGITPLIWRRVIVPAGATFNRLHETIQNITNFQSRLSPYHSFGVRIDDYFITDNGLILEEYKGKEYAGKTVKQPARIKIDTYLEKHGHILYTYDFGDDWRIRVELEDTVEDYYFGYPTLLAGEGTAPPEDVGGPSEYEAFKKVYQDPTHPDYLSTRAWAERQDYLPLDMVEVNERLKYVKYKKTEWENINHERYHVISDKYRGADSVELVELPNKELIMQYAIACTNLYGWIEYPKFLEIYNAQNEPALSSSELRTLVTDSDTAKMLEKAGVFSRNSALVHAAFNKGTHHVTFLQAVKGKPFYVPAKEELLRYVDALYYETTNHHEMLTNMLAKDFFGGSTFMIKGEIDELIGQLQGVGIDFQSVLREFLARFDWKDRTQLNLYGQVVTVIANTTRIWENRGHTPHELFEMEKSHVMPQPNAPINAIDEGKTGRNEPCPCGSGKKYKKCCGK